MTDGALDLAALSRRLVDRKTGLVRRLAILPRAADQARLAHVLARLPDYAQLPSSGAIVDPCGGRQRLADAARQVLLECVERYCASFANHRQLVLARPYPDGPFLYGARLPLYADAEYAAPGFPFRRLDERSRIHWAEGRSLVTGRPWFVPAPLVFIPWRSVSEDEWLGPGTSTGMACESSWARAALIGLLEVIEREAFTLAWMHRSSRPRLRVAPGSPLWQELAAIVAPCGDRARPSFVDLSTDLGAPVVLAVLESRACGRRVVTVGAAAKPRFDDAARKALYEAVCDAVRLRDRLAAGLRWEAAPGFANVNDWTDHSLVYLDAQWLPALDFLTASPVERSIDDLDRAAPGGDAAALLARQVEAVARRGEDVVAITLTTPEIAELGLHVVKVFVPGAVPLHPDHRYPWLGHRRLYDVPVSLGWRGDRAAPEELNPMPHPFA